MWEWLSLNGGGLSALAAVVTAVIAIIALDHTARDSRERSRPMMVAEFRLAEHNDASIDFVLRNAGPSIARGVTVEFQPALEVPDDGDRYVTPALIRRYETAMELVRSMSRRWIASTSPIRAEVPSMTSTIAPSWPSGFGPEIARPASQAAITARMALTSSGLSAFGTCGSQPRHAVERVAGDHLVTHR